VRSAEQSSASQRRSMLRTAAGCWDDTRGWGERRALAGYVARQLLWRAGLRRGARGTIALSVGGLRLEVLPGNGELYLYQEIFRDAAYEQHPAFRLQPGWRVVDAGANIGVFSLRAARAGCVRVLAIEPDPITFARLVRHVRLNCAESVIPLAVAVGANPRRAVYRRGGASTTGRISRRGESAPADAAEIVVEVEPLAQLLDRHGLDTVNLLKIDVEGDEAEVLQGAVPALARIERVVMEYHGEERLAESESLLASQGFRRVMTAPPAYAYFARRGAA
jgi:FkbM family methyltransferase